MASNKTVTAFEQTAATTPNTTFVQADPSNFRAVVQKLSGASDNPSTPKLPLTLPSRLHHHRQTTTTAAVASAATTTTTTTAPKKPLFKLHERRKKLEQLNIASTQQHYCNSSSSSSSMTMFNAINMNMMSMNIISPYRNKQTMLVVASSPVSTLDGAAARGSPRSAEEEEDERVIAEKGFYLHPISPLSSSNTPRSTGSHPPQLLPLFPLHSPNASSSSSSPHNNNNVNHDNSS